MTRVLNWFTKTEIKKFGLTWTTRWGPDPHTGEWSPYQTLISVGRWRLHCFHRGDGDREFHDHMWDFWTFPLVSYYEDIQNAPGDYTRRKVERFRRHYRKAEFAHRVTRAVGGDVDRRIWTIVRTGPKRREWGFWTLPETIEAWNDERNCYEHKYVPARWIHWKEFLKERM